MRSLKSEYVTVGHLISTIQSISHLGCMSVWSQISSDSENEQRIFRCRLRHLRTCRPIRAEHCAPPITAHLAPIVIIWMDQIVASFAPIIAHLATIFIIWTNQIRDEHCGQLSANHSSPCCRCWGPRTSSSAAASSPATDGPGAGTLLLLAPCMSTALNSP